MKIWKKYYQDAIPWYLARHYWWAYLWKVGVWFFDHQWIINTILFGKYQTLMRRCLQTLSHKKPGRVLQLTCVYGSLTRHLHRIVKDDLHIADIADIQLKATIKKIPAPQHHCYFERMNAERLGFQNNAFDTVLIFFLLHEVTPEARERVLQESIRVLGANGRLIIVEYAELGHRHLFHKFALFRLILGRLEPFLPGFWHESLAQKVELAASRQERRVNAFNCELLFNGFYRVVEIELN